MQLVYGVLLSVFIILPYFKQYVIATEKAVIRRSDGRDVPRIHHLEMMPGAVSSFVKGMTDGKPTTISDSTAAARRPAPV
ncbi:MAG: hypothetical protein MZU97_11030 [Bacillus subtilis]|nr:hypothetical protein [Bacillus subtilis]